MFANEISADPKNDIYKVKRTMPSTHSQEIL
jgi:hypothetical protein